MYSKSKMYVKWWGGNPGDNDSFQGPSDVTIYNPFNQISSWVFCWLRDKRSGKHFSHTRLGVCVQVCGGFRSSGLCKGQFLFCHSPLPRVSSSFSFQSVRITCLLCSHFLPVLMAKDSSCTKSRAAKQLESYNKSQTNCSSEQSGNDRVSYRRSCSRTSRSSHARSSPQNTSAEPLDWVSKSFLSSNKPMLQN